jgi:CheY-like chemotaxis protein
LIKINFEAVDDGEKAVKLFEERNRKLSSKNIHVIIMDLNMVNMDGDVAT